MIWPQSNRTQHCNLRTTVWNNVEARKTIQIDVHSPRMPFAETSNACGSVAHVMSLSSSASFSDSAHRSHHNGCGTGYITLFDEWMVGEDRADCRRSGGGGGGVSGDNGSTIATRAVARYDRSRGKVLIIENTLNMADTRVGTNDDGETRTELLLARGRGCGVCGGGGGGGVGRRRLKRVVVLSMVGGAAGEILLVAELSAASLASRLVSGLLVGERLLVIVVAAVMVMFCWAVVGYGVRTTGDRVYRRTSERWVTPRLSSFAVASRQSTSVPLVTRCAHICNAYSGSVGCNVTSRYLWLHGTLLFSVFLNPYIIIKLYNNII